jgi:oxygen-independent coproporphyrinogen-3 oxidase
MFPKASGTLEIDKVSGGVLARLSGRACYRSLRESSLTLTAKLAAYEVVCATTGERRGWGSLTGVKPLKKYASLRLSGKNAEETREFFRYNYDSSEAKIDLLEKTWARQEPYSRLPSRDVCLYVNVPICPARCDYCSFPSIVSNEGSSLVESYAQTLAQELEILVNFAVEENLNVISVYVGGGTPTILSEAGISRICRVLQPITASRPEFTFEAGRADTITEAKIDILQRAGVNRISVNPQSMREETMVSLGRNIPNEQFTQAFDLARGAGMDVNCDLIFGLPGESEEDMLSSLEAVLALAPENVSLHSLAAKRTGALDRTRITSNPEDVSAFQDFALRRMREASYDPYYVYRLKNAASAAENVGYCRNSRLCVYNVAMMGDRIGVLCAGAGASGKIVDDRDMSTINFRNPKDLTAYKNGLYERVRARVDLVGETLSR